MSGYEYKVIAAPRRAGRVKGARTDRDRFAATLTELINEVAVDGWEFYRSETLPQEVRPGMLKSRVERLESLLVFRRPLRSARDAADSLAARFPLPGEAGAPVAPAAPPLPEPPRPEAPRHATEREPLRRAPPLRVGEPEPEESNAPVIKLAAPKRDGED
ncbi:MAG: DUF4177 domain-containing protein [Alphaproteobacteria bacterium]|nr:MAG: DUF4177 domain-containing protein [Alphaproteobacteria bacterium]